jgi:hypothetical protein
MRLIAAIPAHPDAAFASGDATETDGFLRENKRAIRPDAMPT